MAHCPRIRPLPWHCRVPQAMQIDGLCSTSGSMTPWQDPHSRHVEKSWILRLLYTYLAVMVSHFLSSAVAGAMGNLSNT